MSNDPVLIAYGVRRSVNGKRTTWRRIGEAIPHAEGAGLTVILDVLPLDGRIILLERDAADDKRLDGETSRLSRRAMPIVRS